jgi:hypothetical protein
MNTLDKLLDEAAELEKDALVLLLEGVKRLLRNARAFDLAPRGKRYRLIPLGEMEYYDLRKKSIAIKECWVPWLAKGDSGECLNLAQAYVVLRKGGGNEMSWLDTYKEAYSFPFEMIIAHNGKDVSYLLVVATYKSSLEIRFRKVVPANDRRLKDPIYYPPEEEFDEEEQTYFQTYFIGFLKGLFESMSPIPLEPFANSEFGTAVCRRAGSLTLLAPRGGSHVGRSPTTRCQGISHLREFVVTALIAPPSHRRTRSRPP